MLSFSVAWVLHCLGDMEATGMKMFMVSAHCMTASGPNHGRLVVEAESVSDAMEIARVQAMVRWDVEPGAVMLSAAWEINADYVWIS